MMEYPGLFQRSVNITFTQSFFIDQLFDFIIQLGLIFYDTAQMVVFEIRNACNVGGTVQDTAASA